MIGERGSPQLGTNVLFQNFRQVDTPTQQNATYQLTVSELVAELKPFTNETVLYLPWPLSIKTSGEVDAPVEEAARSYCAQHTIEGPLLHKYDRPYRDGVSQ